MATSQPGNEPMWSGSRVYTLIFSTAYEEDIIDEQCSIDSVVAVKAQTNPTRCSGAGIALLQGRPRF